MRTWVNERAAVTAAPAVALSSTGTLLVSPWESAGRTRLPEAPSSATPRNIQWNFKLSMLAMTLATGAVAEQEAYAANENLTIVAHPSRPATSFSIEESGAVEGMTGLSNWLSSWMFFDGARSAPSTTVSTILRDIDALHDGWNGENTLAPQKYVKEDIRRLNFVAIAEWRTPEVEVDNDGTVALRWDGDDHMVALTFNGNGRVIGTMYPRINEVPKEMSLSDPAALSSFFSIEEVKSAIS